ncbi:hypothetical protein IHN63_00415 [Deinococcus sp. 6YEL10]|uniref:hypothetical protein n=1 Tax=Deinococcus sp. 6YEL10 TaxID=2745870 RepID=UPI001E341DF3|nr:hypothetical protein [Deinococcus sp. 6YEL10]MCD0159762.1 hypothetical protein [Deinococcus sp. 6YEL10]
MTPPKNIPLEAPETENATAVANPAAVLERLDVLELKEAMTAVEKTTEPFAPVIGALDTLRRFVGEVVTTTDGYKAAVAKRDAVVESIQKKYGIALAEGQIDLESGAFYGPKLGSDIQ